MGPCQYPNGGCLYDDAANACPLCDEDGADRIAEYYSDHRYDHRHEDDSND